MRLIGNKTHGDLAEIAISEFINQYMYDFQSTHVGKDLYRAKSQEEDIKIINEITKVEFPVSLKAYGHGPLQLSTDKNSSMFQLLENERKEEENIVDKQQIRNLLNSSVFLDFSKVNILSLIYDEGLKHCNILVFNYNIACQYISRIVRTGPGGRRRHPVYKFYDFRNNYIFEVRYGGATANALQRGLWTHTKKGYQFFDSITDGWVNYSDNQFLVSLFSSALVSSETGHSTALKEIEKDIRTLKQSIGVI